MLYIIIHIMCRLGYVNMLNLIVGLIGYVIDIKYIY